jgi:hypothetical protein
MSVTYSHRWWLMYSGPKVKHCWSSILPLDPSEITVSSNDLWPESYEPISGVPFHFDFYAVVTGQLRVLTVRMGSCWPVTGGVYRFGHLAERRGCEEVRSSISSRYYCDHLPSLGSRVNRKGIIYVLNYVVLFGPFFKVYTIISIRAHTPTPKRDSLGQNAWWQQWLVRDEQGNVGFSMFFCVEPLL